MRRVWRFGDLDGHRPCSGATSPPLMLMAASMPPRAAWVDGSSAQTLAGVAAGIVGRLRHEVESTTMPPVTGLPISAAGRADLSRTVAVIPVRSLEGAKSRLGEQLDAEERHALVSALLAQAVDAASGAAGVRDVIVVSPDEDALAVATERGAAVVRQVSLGLNEGLDEARAWA